MTGFKATVCASTGDNCAPTRWWQDERRRIKEDHESTVQQPIGDDLKRVAMTWEKVPAHRTTWSRRAEAQEGHSQMIQFKRRRLAQNTMWLVSYPLMI